MLKFRFYEYHDEEKGCQAVKAVTTYEGKSVYGIAYLHPDDAYDFELGKTIAKYRCYIKVIDKKIKRYGRKTKSIQEDMLYLASELEHLTQVIKTYEQIVQGAIDERAAANAELEKILATIS